MKYSVSLNITSKQWRVSCHDDWHGWHTVVDADRVIVPDGSECVTEWGGFRQDEFVGGFLEVHADGLTVDDSGVLRFCNVSGSGSSSPEDGGF